jgi:hypothetical protein
MHEIPLPIQIDVALLLALFGMVFLFLSTLILADYGALPFVQRAALGREVRQLRMDGMLRLRGIPRSLYLHQTSLHQLRLDVARCRSCSGKARCDQVMKAGPGLDPGYSFCPNTASLSRLQAGN